MNKKDKYKWIRSFIKILCMFIVSIVIGINIYSWNASRILGDAMPMPSGYGAAVVLSGSMEPKLSIDDLIIVRKMDKYNIDDIIVYQKNYELVVHRIISINENEVITKGDANNINDNAISINSIKGRVIGVIPYVGVFVKLIKTPMGVIFVIGVSLILYMYSNKKEKMRQELELKEIQEEINRLKEEK